MTEEISGRVCLSADSLDETISSRPESSDFEKILDGALNRRDFLSRSVRLGLSSFLVGIGVTMSASGRTAQGSVRFIDSFESVKASTADTITLPPGFDWQVVVKWGDPLWSQGIDFDDNSRGTGQSQELAFGDNNDGMALFITTDGRNLLAVNNEYINRGLIYGNRASRQPETADDVRKGKAAHGVCIVELVEKDGQWRVVRDSPYNRKITPDTAFEITGPLRGHPAMKTAADPEGIEALGTWNNCGSGRTPWGTYLACEENFNGYFSSIDPKFQPDDAMKRYGISGQDRGYRWATYDERFDVGRHPNEPNRAGFVVEIDPANPKSKPRKLTALGRFKHENAELVIAADGRVVVYMGDDERGEYLYRFVSDGQYRSDSKNNHELLTRGTLYVARFYGHEKGEWLPLIPETTGMSKAEIALHTRMAASKAGGTTMDRPEWVAASPDNSQVLCCLTNNINRGVKTNRGGDETPVGGPNPRARNLYGQIVRWRPEGKDHAANTFIWDLFVLAGNPEVHRDGRSGSTNIHSDNMFNSPDGLAFDTLGNLWIGTDGNYSNQGNFAGMGNNQLLIGDVETGEIKRFLVGPRESEVTGITWSADYKTVFVGIQHPGERGGSSFPRGGDNVPQSCVIAIRRRDGTRIG